MDNKNAKSDKDLPGLLSTITYIIPVEDNDAYEASFMQGFARSLMQNTEIIRLINTLPSDVLELTEEGQKVRLARRMSGQAPVNWYAQSSKVLTSVVTPVFAPFLVVFFGPNHKFSKYKSWIDAHPFPLTVVAESGGTISYENFSIETLRDAFLGICHSLEGQVRASAIEEEREYLLDWTEPETRDLGYQVGGHNSVYPNLMALKSAGFENMIYGPFKKISEGMAPYVEQICQTTRSILEERDDVGERLGNQYFRRPPALNLFAPSIYPHVREISLKDGPFDDDDKRRFLEVRRALENQEGYAFDAKTKAQAKIIFGPNLNADPQPHFLMMERADELRLGTECVATLAASEISSVLRLPNSVNRTAGQVRQFAQQYHARATNDRKRVEVFRRVQIAITKSVPHDLFEFIEAAEEGIRIISDAHLEWLSIRGLPLCIQKDVTRIPVTPGNLFIEQVSAKPYVHLTVSDFSEVLILSALQEEDPIGKFFDVALEGFAPHYSGKITVRTERIRNKADLVAALNSFEGAMAIFDGHGGHQPGKAATLQLLEESVNIWELQAERPRMPPIVVLSACDTHAADRNHASTANGFLSIGAKTVLGSVFPIDAMDASSFVARLVYRVAEFVPSAHAMFKRSLTWMEIMGGMLRMQLLTDFCRRLEREGHIDRDILKAVHNEGNMAINTGHEWPFEHVISSLVQHGVDEKRAKRVLHSSTANSTSISYLQLGRPETIIVHPDEGFVERAEESG